MVDLNFTPFPVLTTKRLRLRQIEITDDNEIFRHRSDEAVNKYLVNFRHPTISQTRAFITKIQKAIEANESIYWVLTLKDTGKFIGTICLWNISHEEQKAETGYTLLPAYQKMGFMQEALEEVIRYGLINMKLQSIEAYTHIDNSASTKLLLKNKFIKDENHMPLNGSKEILFILKPEQV